MPSFLSAVTASVTEGAVARQWRALAEPQPLPQSPPGAQVQTETSPTPAPTALTPLTLDGMFGSVFAHTCGCLTLTSGPFTVTAPCEYNDTGAAFWPEQPERDASSLDLSVSISRGMNAKITWGSLCAFQGAETAVAVYGLEVKTSGRSVVDPFDLCMQLVVSPLDLLRATVRAGAGAGASLEGDRLQIEHPFWPHDTSAVTGDAVPSNTVDLSVVASPVHLHVSEALAACLARWMHAIDRSFQAMHTSLSLSGLADLSAAAGTAADARAEVGAASVFSPPPAVVAVVPAAVEVPTAPPLALGFVVKCHALLHEVACVVEGPGRHPVDDPRPSLASPSSASYWFAAPAPDSTLHYADQQNKSCMQLEPSHVERIVKACYTGVVVDEAH